jgi:hypothetical protein
LGEFFKKIPKYILKQKVDIQRGDCLVLLTGHDLLLCYRLSSSCETVDGLLKTLQHAYFDYLTPDIPFAQNFIHDHQSFYRWSNKDTNKLLRSFRKKRLQIWQLLGASCFFESLTRIGASRYLGVGFGS